MSKLNKYKVEFTLTQVYVIDVLAKDEDIAKDIATKKYKEYEKGGMLHYYETTGFEEEITGVYDATHTDDPFNP